MQKEYKSNVVLSLVMPSGKRVTFDELSGGCGSVFVTSDEALQRELENHGWFGTKFKLRKTQQQAANAAGVVAGGSAQPSTAVKNEMMEVEISDPGEAKEWLAEHFQDVSRTKLRSKEAIIETAKMKGVVFKGL